jgi:hypothetical protein
MRVAFSNARTTTLTVAPVSSAGAADFFEVLKWLIIPKIGLAVHYFPSPIEQLGNGPLTAIIVAVADHGVGLVVFRSDGTSFGCSPVMGAAVWADHCGAPADSAHWDYAVRIKQ